MMFVYAKEIGLIEVNPGESLYISEKMHAKFTELLEVFKMKRRHYLLCSISFSFL